jgi:hypothetical protein
MDRTAEQSPAAEKQARLRIIVYALRIVGGVFLIALFLTAASRTTRDCTVGLYIYDICAWVWVREQLGLPASKFLRAAFLELIGITLTLGIFLTIRFVLPFWGTRKATDMDRENKPHQASLM